MTLRHMKIFLAVCNCRCNTTQAAAALHMTQPAVSLAIQELETYYGVRLFDRIGRRLKLTAAGEQFQAYAGHIAQLFADMELQLRNGEKFGPLRVGASITIGAQFLPSYVKTFMELHPGARIQASIGPSEGLEQKLVDNILDFALMEGTVHGQVLVAEPYMMDHLTVICPANGPFTPGQCLTQKEFRQQQFLLREKGSGTREEFDRAVEAAGFSVEPIWEATSTTALVNGVISGIGIAVLPQRMVLGPLERGLVIPVQVEGLRFCRRFYIVYHKDKFLSPLAKDFLELCRNYEMDYPMPQYNGLF